jgi:hypothetical protein
MLPLFFEHYFGHFREVWTPLSFLPPPSFVPPSRKKISLNKRWAEADDDDSGIEPVPTITARPGKEIPWRIYVCGVANLLCYSQ